uniref:Uncharacterized protein n=1 Tax=Timema monikensis TaxID=170555 RepID=A0A7R9EDR0_9NEOP|nr:unnamed protein product [Timema monikensis]
MASLVSDSQDGEDVGDVEDVDQTLTARNELDLTFTVPENNHSLSDDPSDITFIQTTSRESDLMTSDGPLLEAIECVSFPNLLSTISVDTIVQSTEEMCKTFMVPGLSGELLENTTSTSSSSLAHRLENFKDYFKQNENNLTSINTTKFDFNEPLDFSSKSNRAIDYLIKPSIKKNPMDTVLSEHSQNGRYNLADESVPWPNTSGISKMQDNYVSSRFCSKTFTQCYDDPKEQLPQDTSKAKLDNKPVRDLTTLSKIPIPKSSALASAIYSFCGPSVLVGAEGYFAKGKVSRIPLRTNVQLDKLRPRNPLQSSNANVNQKSQPLLLTKPKIQIGYKKQFVCLDVFVNIVDNKQPGGSRPAIIRLCRENSCLDRLCAQRHVVEISAEYGLSIARASPGPGSGETQDIASSIVLAQGSYSACVNVGFELGQNIAEGSYGNNTKRQATAAKRRWDANSLAGKMPNRTRAGVLERQQSYANMGSSGSDDPYSMVGAVLRYVTVYKFLLRRLVVERV